MALTNWSAETFHHAVERYEFLGWFEDVVVSGRELIAKPDPRIFDLLIRRFSLRPEATVFIDDNEPNVDAAVAAGIHGLHFTDPPALRHRLADLGLIPTA